MRMLTMGQIEKEVLRLDKNAKNGGGGGFRVACVLLAALQVGANARRVAKFTGYPLPFVQEVGRRLRKSGVWANEKTCCDWHQKDGTISFWLDVCIGQGFIEKVPAKAKA